MSSILAGAVMVLIGLGCITKHMGCCGRTKNTEGQVHQREIQDEEQQHDPKLDEKDVDKNWR